MSVVHIVHTPYDHDEIHQLKGPAPSTKLWATGSQLDHETHDE